jgi:hypothetical protein
MRRLALSLVPVFALAALTQGTALAQKKKAAATKAGGAPAASDKEVEKLKGEFKWGMTPDEVLKKMVEKVEASYEERLKKTINDPAKQDRVRKEMFAEQENAKKHSLVKFEGQRTGYDVSIIDQEFSHNVGESMLVAKEDNGTRYFFFASDRLFKMFVAFDKDMLAGKSFKEFGQLMQGRFGRAKEVYVDEKTKAGVNHRLDHFAWHSKGGDTLRLVDRSAFYDVFCLVIAEGSTAERQLEARKAHAKAEKRDALVEAVTAGKPNERDSNDNVIDRITGKDVHKPGDQQAQDIKVPSPTAPGVRGPTPAEVNRKEPADEKADEKSDAKGKGKGKDSKPSKPGIEL